MIENFLSQQAVDKYYPDLNTYLKGIFESVMEIPIDDVKHFR
jgi:hypothetical protein